MSGASAWFWILPGHFVGLVIAGLGGRWFRALGAALGINLLPDMQVASSDRKVFRIFTVLNPYPWLVLLGIPYLVYRQITDPLSAGWFWFYLGAVLTVIALPLLGVVLWWRNRRRSKSEVV